MSLRDAYGLTKKGDALRMSKGPGKLIFDLIAKAFYISYKSQEVILIRIPSFFSLYHFVPQKAIVNMSVENAIRNCTVPLTLECRKARLLRHMYKVFEKS